jgi:YD repeat-containing protein
VLRADGTTIATEYDESRQPVNFTDSDGARWSYTYDEAGLLSEVTGPCGEHAGYRHDLVERVSEYRDLLGRVTRTVLDRAGLPIEMAGPDGAVTRLRRDAPGRVVEITDPPGARAMLSWNIEGQPLERVLPDGAWSRLMADGPASRDA